MRVSPIYATLAAAALLFTGANVGHASDGGKGGNSGQGSTNSGPGNNNNGNCNSGCNNNNNNNGNCNMGCNNHNNATQVRLRTRLAGAAIAGRHPEGNADFRNDGVRMRLNVEVENVNLANGTVLTVAIVHNGTSTAAGTIMVNSSSDENELELDSQNGNMVPTVVAGDMTTVSNRAQVILAGVF